MVKVCTCRRSPRCLRNQTVQPYKLATQIKWRCTECAKVEDNMDGTTLIRETLTGAAHGTLHLRKRLVGTTG